MLELKGIKKDYLAGENTVHALKGIDLKFRQSEFVSILGQSGCGKTTMLNIIGGLDQYTEDARPKISKTATGTLTEIIPSALFFRAITSFLTRQFCRMLSLR